jgi:hypothetical protein
MTLPINHHQQHNKYNLGHDHNTSSRGRNERYTIMLEEGDIGTGVSPFIAGDVGVVCILAPIFLSFATNAHNNPFVVKPNV